MDGGLVALDNADDMQRYVETCRELRFWEREGTLMM
jgi:hypothetical protein